MKTANVKLNKIIILILPAFFLLPFLNILHAQVKISGFFDVVGIKNFHSSAYNQFKINQFEMDASYENKTHYSVGTAIAYNNKLNTMELTMAFIHYTFDDSQGKHPRRKEEYNHSALLIGMFDMPFGLDYLSYASIDRPTITQPLVIEKTIAGWNDIGIDYHLFADKIKFEIWAVNGFSKGVGIGGNLRYKLFPSCEIGFSHSSDIYNFNRIDDWLSGMDFSFTSNIFQIKSEFLWMKGVYEGKPDTILNNEIHSGAYLQLLTNLENWISLPAYFVLRGGFWQCASNNITVNDSQYRYTFALGYKLDENLFVRMEISSDKFERKETETKGYLQLVVAF